MCVFHNNFEVHNLPLLKMSTLANSESRSSEPPFKLESIESLRLHWSSFCARLQSHLSIQTIRPLPEFLGLRKTSANDIQFSPNACTNPITPDGDQNVIYEKIRHRIEQNCTYYLSNYALIAAVTALVILLFHPDIIFTFALLSALWWFHGYLIRHEVVVASVRVHEIFPVQHRFYVLFLQSCFMILVTSIIPTVLFLLVSGSIIFCHAVFRDTSHLPSEQYDTESPRRTRKVSFQMEEMDPYLDSP